MNLKKLGLFGRLIYGINVFVALLLVISFVLPYLSPSKFPLISLLSLAVSPLILLNLLFAVYWLIRLKRRFLLSTIILVISYFHFNPFLEFSSEVDAAEFNHSLKVLSYNVRLFNAYEKDPSDEFLILFSKIIEQHEPDVICIQEFFKKRNISFSKYPYRYVHYKGESNKLGHAIFSKYPIIKKGAFDFEDSFNNTLYADIVKGKDTIRVYNLHLQSLGIIPSVDYLQEGNKERMLKRLSRGFTRQEKQTLTILKHKATSPHPVIMTGDFNNTPFSYIYRKFEEEMQDGFLKRGSGLGTTFRFDSYPMRIDYIFADPKFEFVKFNTISETFSDHHPVTATLVW